MIKIWSIVKYGKCDPFILENQDQQANYILCCPDFEWEYDPLRENQYNQMELFEKYHSDLVKNNYNFTIAQGRHEQRLSLVEKTIKQLML